LQAPRGYRPVIEQLITIYDGGVVAAQQEEIGVGLLAVLVNEAVEDPRLAVGVGGEGEVARWYGQMGIEQGISQFLSHEEGRVSSGHEPVVGV